MPLIRGTSSTMTGLNRVGAVFNGPTAYLKAGIMDKSAFSYVRQNDHKTGSKKHPADNGRPLNRVAFFFIDMQRAYISHIFGSYQVKAGNAHHNDADDEEDVSEVFHGVFILLRPLCCIRFRRKR